MFYNLAKGGTLDVSPKTNSRQTKRKEIEMNLTPEQLAAAQKANLETLSGLTNQALKNWLN